MEFRRRGTRQAGARSQASVCGARSKSAIRTYRDLPVKIGQDTSGSKLVEIDPTWEHLGDQRLRRSARLIFGTSAQHLLLDLTIEGVTVFYRNTAYRFTRGIEALIAVITSDVEEFITAQSQGTN
jgi:hypothetical protein